MEVRAVGRKVRVPPRKARLVAAELKGKHVVRALAELKYHPSKGARVLRKVLSSAVGNAVENEKLDADSLVISRIQVDEGARMKRYRARAMGRGNRILKRTSHITVVLEERGPYEPRKSRAKPKARPKFEAPKPKRATKTKAETEGGEGPAAETLEARADKDEGPAETASAGVEAPSQEEASEEQSEKQEE